MRAGARHDLRADGGRVMQIPQSDGPPAGPAAAAEGPANRLRQGYGRPPMLQAKAEAGHDVRSVHADRPGALRVGDLVRVRRHRWRVADVRAYSHCQLVTLSGAGAFNSGVQRRVLAPFDVIDLARTLPSAIVVNAAQPAEDVVRDALAAILEHLGRRTTKRLRLPVETGARQEQPVPPAKRQW